MKKTLLVLSVIVCFFVNIGTAQEWEKIDSVQKSKEQIYSDTKMFIAEYWKSAQNVIQNDDKEGGTILVKGSLKTINRGAYKTQSLIYSYTVLFLIRDQKYKIVVKNVQYMGCDCKDVSSANVWENKELNIQSEFPGIWKSNTSKVSWEILMDEVKSYLQQILTEYDKYIKSPSQIDNW